MLQYRLRTPYFPTCEGFAYKIEALGHLENWIAPPITNLVEFEVISETSAQIESAKRQFAATPEIQLCFYVTDCPPEGEG